MSEQIFRRMAGPVLHALGARVAGEVPASVQTLLDKLKRIPGVKATYIADTWHDGYFHLRVVVEPKASRNSVGGTSDKAFRINTSAHGGYVVVFNLPDYPAVIRAVQTLTKQSGLRLDSITGPAKLYEFQDARARAQRLPRLSGYDENEISVEVYAAESA